MIGGKYTVRSNGDHPSWDEAQGLIGISKEFDGGGKNTTLEVYKKIREGKQVTRREIISNFGECSGMERILGGLLGFNFIQLKEAHFRQTPYVMDTSSGMYIPFDLARQ